MAETSTIFGFMKYVSATDILSDFKKTVDSYFVNSLYSHNCGYFLSSWKDPNFKMFSIIPKQKNKYGNNQQNNSEI